MKSANDILAELIHTINATGGVVWIGGVPYPEGDRDWCDLAEVYLDACQYLGRSPTESFEDEEEE